MYVPAFGSPEADLIAEWNGKLIRVQVKTLSGEEDSLCYDLRTSSKQKYVGSVDWLALHSMHHGATAFVRPEAAGCTLHIRFDDGGSRPRQNIRYVQDYPLERVIKELSV